MSNRLTITPELRSDFDRLSAGERRVLTLLASGHTVKSIANSTGISVAGINERLRSARRKTGVGSSRELARLLAQEIDDEKIGLAQRVAVPDSNPSARGRRFGAASNKGWIIMVLGLLAAAAAALIAQNHPANTAHDPLIGDSLTEQMGAPLAVEPDFGKMVQSQGTAAAMRKLYAEVRSGPRDQRWSGSAEAALRINLARISSGNLPADRSRVTCSASLCEIAAAPPSNSPKGTMESFVAASQAAPFTEANAKAGLQHLVSTFAGVDRKRLVYLSYWRRAEQRR